MSRECYEKKLLPWNFSFNALTALSDVNIDRGRLVLVRRNNIPELPSGLFRKQHRLREIDLPRNEIRTLQRGAFRFASRVQVVNLERNRLERLERNVFAGLVNVTHTVYPGLVNITAGAGC